MAETAPVARAKGQLGQRFPGLRMQVSACRKIAGSSTWSQHSFDNAIDIFAGRGTLDLAAAYLRSNKGQLSVNNVLWQVRDHYDHIHVDFFPKGIGVPRCAGGPGKMTGDDTGGDPAGDVGGADVSGAELSIVGSLAKLGEGATWGRAAQVAGGGVLALAGLYLLGVDVLPKTVGKALS